MNNEPPVDYPKRDPDVLGAPKRLPPPKMLEPPAAVDEGTNLKPPPNKLEPVVDPAAPNRLPPAVAPVDKPPKRPPPLGFAVDSASFFDSSVFGAPDCSDLSSLYSVLVADPDRAPES